MEAKIDKRTGRHRLRNREAARVCDDERCAVLPQEKQHRRAEARLMTELHRDAHTVVRCIAQEIGDSSEILVIGMKAWRELQQNRPEFVLQRSRALEEFAPRLPHIAETFDMRDEAGKLEREGEIVGRCREPVLIRGDAWQLIE